MDFGEKYYEKSRLNNNIISLKLQEFQNLIEDFNLQNFEKFSTFLEKINKNKSEIFKPIKDIKNIFNINIKNSENINSESKVHKKISSKRISMNKMEIDKSSSIKEIEKQKTKNNFIGKSSQIANGKLRNKVNDNSF